MIWCCKLSSVSSLLMYSGYATAPVGQHRALDVQQINNHHQHLSLKKGTIAALETCRRRYAGRAVCEKRHTVTWKIQTLRNYSDRKY